MSRTDYPFRLSVRLFFEKAKQAQIIVRAIFPGLSSPHSKRSLQKITLKKNILSLDIYSLDNVALLATSSGLLKKIILAKSISEVK